MSDRETFTGNNFKPKWGRKHLFPLSSVSLKRAHFNSNKCFGTNKIDAEKYIQNARYSHGLKIERKIGKY